MSSHNKSNKSAPIPVVEDDVIETTATVAGESALAVPNKDAAAVVPEGYFNQPAAVEGAEAQDGGGIYIPYVGFRGIKSVNRIAELDAAGIPAMEFYLYDSMPLRVKPFQLHLLKWCRFFTWVTNDSEAKVQAARLKYSQEDFNNGFREQINALVAVVIPGGGDKPNSFVPATLQLRGGLCKALQRSIQIIDKDAANPTTWATKSAQHAKAAKAAWAGGRFRVTIYATSEKPANAGKGANAYNLGHETVAPTPEGDVSSFNRFVGVEPESYPGENKFQSHLVPAATVFERRRGALIKLAGQPGSLPAGK